MIFGSEGAFGASSMGFDGTCGGRRLTRRWKSQGTTAKVKCLVRLDMIGDKQLDIQRESNSTRWRVDIIRNTAIEQEVQNILTKGLAIDIQDDHLPFLEIDIPSIDVISWKCAPWHTAGDTLDIISSSSIEKVGRLVLFAPPWIEARLLTK